MLHTVTPNPKEMEKNIARFANLTPTVKRHEASSGIPPDLYEMFSARRTYVFMAPEGLKGPISGGAGIVGGDGGEVFRVGLAICPHETFINVKGKWEVRWGDKAEHATHLDLYDTIAVPPGVCRQFKNIGEEDANLIVIIQGDRDKFNDVYNPVELRERVVERFGAGILPKLSEIGIRFLDEEQPDKRAAG